MQVKHLIEVLQTVAQDAHIMVLVDAKTFDTPIFTHLDKVIPVNDGLIVLGAEIEK